MGEIIKLEKIDPRYSEYRILRPEIVRSIQSSMGLMGQLQPVILRKNEGLYELIDGFKRYYAARGLKWDSLHGQVVEIDDITAKTLIMRYNQQSSPLLDYEEAKIVFSLKTEHGMKQEEISRVLSRSLSWVSRRLSFIERLGEGVQHQLRLGTISPSHARELVKLPRGKQEDFLRIIIQHSLSSRNTAIIISIYHLSESSREQEYLLKNPIEVLSRYRQDPETYDCRLGTHGNRLLKSARVLRRQQHIFIGYSTHPSLKELTSIETDVLRGEFIDIVKKAKIIQSILNAYQDHER